MHCDACDAEPAVLLVSNTQNGDTSSVGANCLPAWAATLLATNLEPGEAMSLLAGFYGQDTSEPVPDPTTGDDTDDDAAQDTATPAVPDLDELGDADVEAAGTPAGDDEPESTDGDGADSLPPAEAVAG